MEKKMTYAQAIDNAINGTMTDEVKARLEELKASLAKRSQGKATKTQEANVGIKEVIMDVLAKAESALTVTEMLKDERLSEYSGSKITSLVTQLVKDGKVERAMVQKRARFSLPSADSNEVEEFEE